MDSRDRLPLIHEQPSSQKQSHQEREKNQQNQTKKDSESTEPAFRIENREKKSREIDRGGPDPIESEAIQKEQVAIQKEASKAHHLKAWCAYLKGQETQCFIFQPRT